jgi:hypothetical protein
MLEAEVRVRETLILEFYKSYDISLKTKSGIYYSHREGTCTEVSPMFFRLLFLQIDRILTQIVISVARVEMSQGIV